MLEQPCRNRISPNAMCRNKPQPPLILSLCSISVLAIHHKSPSAQKPMHIKVSTQKETRGRRPLRLPQRMNPGTASANKQSNENKPALCCTSTTSQSVTLRRARAVIPTPLPHVHARARPPRTGPLNAKTECRHVACRRCPIGYRCFSSLLPPSSSLSLAPDGPCRR